MKFFNHGRIPLVILDEAAEAGGRHHQRVTVVRDVLDEQSAQDGDESRKVWSMSLIPLPNQHKRINQPHQK
mgnify:FL=1